MKLRIVAHEAALTEVADDKLHRLFEYKSFNCQAVKVSDVLRLQETSNRNSTPRWRGPARIPDIDDGCATAKFQGQTSKVERCCVRREVGA